MNQVLGVIALAVIAYVGYRLVKKFIADDPFGIIARLRK
jgi:hypothetical protein